ncbi:MAG: hypothetical protein ACRC20_03675 [Segniliparus sp.]|uniref:hypothetical protein n=1 Tax=Segniliparus sp. TaxID=2804064 RepID=UPI003F33F8CF
MSIWGLLTQGTAPWWSTAVTTLCGGVGGAIIAGRFATKNDTRKAERERAQRLSDLTRDFTLELIATRDRAIVWEQDMKHGKSDTSPSARAAKAWELHYQINDALNRLLLVGPPIVLDSAVKLATLSGKFVNQVKNDELEKSDITTLLIEDHYGKLLNAVRTHQELPEYPRNRNGKLSSEAEEDLEELFSFSDSIRKDAASILQNILEKYGPDAEGKARTSLNSLFFDRSPKNNPIKGLTALLVLNNVLEENFPSDIEKSD